MTDVRTEAPQLTDPLDARDHVQGPGNAPLEVVQYGDYECPYCARAHPVIREMRDELGDRMRFGYRHFPLYRQHPHAQNAAEAAEAAAAQGRFWAMHRQLYDNRSALDRMHLVQHAENLNLDTDASSARSTRRRTTSASWRTTRAGARAAWKGRPRCL